MNKPTNKPIKPRPNRLFLVTRNGAIPYKYALDPLEITAIANTPNWGIVSATNPIQAVSIASIRYPDLNIPLPHQNHE